MTASLDPRLNAFRPDLADSRLEGGVAAERFAEGRLRRVVAPSAALRHAPRSDAALDSELLRGELFRVFDETDEGWAWGQNQTDGYVGYTASDALGPVAPEPTHRITALRTFVYPAPDTKLPARSALSFGAAVSVAGETETRGTRYCLLAGGEGALVAIHAAPIDARPEPDYVAVAERFIGTAYLWGGRTSLGLDCSALVQLALMAAGTPAPRDTDMQAASLGRALPGLGDLKRGDLLYWPGHVAIVADATHIVHASGHHMTVVREPLRPALQRIAEKSGDPKARRL
jgi:cell wall-associated NlpC family hydrolase